MHTSWRRWVRGSAWLAGLVLAVALFVPPVAAQTAIETAVTPAELFRISWGAVLAGAVLSIIAQVGLNLLGVGVGFATLNPGRDSMSELRDDAQALGTGAAVWVGVVTLVSAFLAGWVAARLAGIPNGIDGALHGLLAWALATLASLFFLSSGIGSLLSGVGSLINRSLSLAGQVAAGTLRATASVAGGAAQGAANLAGAAASAIGDAAQAAGDAAQDAGGMVQRVINSDAVQGVVQQARDALPLEQIEAEIRERFNLPDDLRDLQDLQGVTFDSILEEAQLLLRQAGIDPDAKRAEVEDAARDVEAVAEATARQAARPDTNTADTVQRGASIILRRLLRAGSELGEDVDRDALVKVISERTNIDEEQAREQLRQWEERAQRARQQVREAQERAQREMQEAIAEARARAQRAADEARIRAEQAAREAAETATKTLSRLALALAGALAVGAIAAGLGGAIGTPEELPRAIVEAPTVVTTPGSGAFTTQPTPVAPLADVTPVVEVVVTPAS